MIRFPELPHQRCWDAFPGQSFWFCNTFIYRRKQVPNQRCWGAFPNETMPLIQIASHARIWLVKQLVLVTLSLRMLKLLRKSQNIIFICCPPKLHGHGQTPIIFSRWPTKIRRPRADAHEFGQTSQDGCSFLHACTVN